MSANHCNEAFCGRGERRTHARDGSAVQHAQPILAHWRINNQSKEPQSVTQQGEIHRVVMGNIQLEGDAAGRRGGDAQLWVRPPVSPHVPGLELR
jgi:hypothetical protein